MKQFNTGRHIHIAVKNIKIGGAGYLENSSGYTVDHKPCLKFQLYQCCTYVILPICSSLSSLLTFLMKNYLLSSKLFSYLFSFSPKGCEISIPSSPEERVLHFLIFLLYFSFYISLPPSALTHFFDGAGQKCKKITHIHWKGNTENKKNSVFPLMNLEKSGVILVISLC